MNLKSLVTVFSAVFLISCCVVAAQPQNLTELIKEIQSNLDRNLDPCHDFYEFACGGFLKTHPVPKNTTGEYLDWPVFQAVVNDTLRAIKKVVQQPWPIINDFYRSCDRSQEEINRSAEETYHNWSEWLNETALTTSTEIWNVIARLNAFEPFFEIGSEVETSNENVTYRGPELSAKDVYLSHDDWKNATKVAEFLEFATHAFSNDTKLVAAKKAETVVSVARYVSSFAYSESESLKLTIANASRLTDIDWEAYFRTTGADLRSSDRIALYDEPYFRNLTKYVTGLPEQTLKNYLQFIVFFNIYEYNETLTCYVGEGDCDGQLQLPGYPHLSRSDKCAFVTAFLLSDLVNFVITEETDSQTTLAAERVVNGLKEATNNTLSALKWITSGKDLKAASSKIQGVLISIGKDRTERYSDVDTQPDNIFDNLFSVTNYENAESIRKSYRAQNRTDFPAYPSLDVINEFKSNLIYVPATLLNSEVFSANWPKLFQFAKLGGLVGRQFIHSIDARGQHLNDVGDFGELFSLNTTRAYGLAQECVAQTYGNYTIGNTTFTTTRNLAEDIADIGGLRNSFEAYRAYIARYGKEFPDGAVIPGFSTDQVFFVISAQMSCSVGNEEFTKNRIAESDYAPNKIRTNGAVSQSVEFAKAFNCPANAPMNPARKCYIF